MSLAAQLSNIRQQFIADLAAGILHAELQNKYLGRKGLVPEVLRELKDEKQAEVKKTVGLAATELRAFITENLSLEATAKEVAFVGDLTIPALPKATGGLHPITAMIDEMVGIFSDLSFEVVEGPELVTPNENFDQLNIGPDHPARDDHDSFYITEELVLRSQTTAVQVNEMKRRFESGKLPMRLVVPGKTYRRESDATHSPMFHQFDAVVVDTETTFADLKGTLDYFAKRLFGDSVITRFRPHHFPFTEPSAEMDIKLKHASGKGKHTGWLEFGGCGMIHPAVLERAGINPKVYRGWAFGMSVERPIMLRHQIPDLRVLTENRTAALMQLNGE